MKIICNIVTFLNIADFRAILKLSSMNHGDKIYIRGVEYEIDDSLETGEMYNYKKVIGGSSYYYHGE